MGSGQLKTNCLPEKTMLRGQADVTAPPQRCPMVPGDYPSQRESRVCCIFNALEDGEVYRGITMSKQKDILSHSPTLLLVH